MRVLVTGATGFIGRALVGSLASDGHAPAALSRDGARAARRLPALAAAFDWDVAAERPPAEALEGADAVVHLAGENVVGRWTAAKKARIRDSRVLGTRHLVEAIAALARRPPVLVAVSAIGVYPAGGEEPLTERSAPGEGFLAELCVRWEAEALRAEAAGVRVVLLRLGLVLAAGGGPLGAMLTPFRLGLGGPIGGGAQVWSWIHRADVVGMIRWAIARPEVAGVYNAVAPGAVPQAAFARTLGRVLRRPAFFPAPAFAVRAALGEFSAELLDSRRVVPERTLAAGYRFAHPELDGALRAILG